MIKRQMKWQYKQQPRRWRWRQMLSFNWNMCVNNCKLREHRPNCRMPCSALKLRSSQAKSECSANTHPPASLCGERRKMSRMFKNRINWKNSWNPMTFVYTHIYCRFFPFFIPSKCSRLQLMVMLFLLLKTVAHVRFGYKVNTICRAKCASERERLREGDGGKWKQ